MLREALHQDGTASLLDAMIVTGANAMAENGATGSRGDRSATAEATATREGRSVRSATKSAVAVAATAMAGALVDGKMSGGLTSDGEASENRHARLVVTIEL